MHMSDALLSAPVAIGAGVAAISLLAIAGAEVKKKDRPDLVSLMGVMGAFIFAAQMVNFSIPGTGSSGHIVGGVLLAAILGPWAAFITLSTVLVIQCLIFADGGLMALGCNIINMGVMTCLVAYPLVFKPLAKYPSSSWRIIWVSALSCLVGLECGALMVTLETTLSNITALSGYEFLILMGSIHLPIGICEGLATGAVICFIQKTRPDLLFKGNATSRATHKNVNIKGIWISFAIAAVIIAGGLAFLASSNPDGLEWSILKVTGKEEIVTENATAIAAAAGHAQEATAFMPDYSHPLSGIVGSIIVLLIVWGVTSLIVKRKTAKNNSING